MCSGYLSQLFGPVLSGLGYSLSICSRWHTQSQCSLSLSSINRSWHTQLNALPMLIQLPLFLHINQQTNYSAPSTHSSQTLGVLHDGISSTSCTLWRVTLPFSVFFFFIRRVRHSAVVICGITAVGFQKYFQDLEQE